MANVKEMMIRKESLKYRDVREYEGKYYDWAEGEHLLEKGMLVDEIFHPLEHDIRFIKDEQVLLRDGVKILTDVYLPADTDEPLPAIEDSDGCVSASRHRRAAARHYRLESLRQELRQCRPLQGALRTAWSGPKAYEWTAEVRRTRP